jgi:hypothetical protein
MGQHVLQGQGDGGLVLLPPGGTAEERFLDFKDVW